MKEKEYNLPDEIAGKRFEDITEETELTQEQFDALLLYNSTIPSGKTIGKKWRKDWNGVHYLAEYEKYINDGKDIHIKWTHIKIIKSAPKDDTPTEITELTQAECNELLVYNHSIPTGTQEGKRFKRGGGKNGVGEKDVWFMGEFGKKVYEGNGLFHNKLIWTRIKIVDGQN